MILSFKIAGKILDRFPLDIRAEIAETLLDLFVAAVHLLNAGEGALSLGEEGGDDHRGARSEVEALDVLAVKRRGASDDGAVRIADDGVRAHFREFVDVVHPPLIKGVVDEGIAFCLGCEDRERRLQVSGQPGIGARFHFGERSQLRGRSYVQLVAFLNVKEDAGFFQFLKYQVQVIRYDVLDDHFSARGSGGDGESARLDRIRLDGVARAVQALDSVYLDRMEAAAADIRAHLPEEPAEVLDMRLDGGSADGGGAFGKRRGHHEVLGGGDGKFLEYDLLADQSIRFEIIELVILGYPGAECFERVEMDADRTCSDDASARLLDLEFTESGEQAPQEQDRRAHASDQHEVHLLGVHVVTGFHSDRPFADLLDFHSHALEYLDHVHDISDARDIVDYAFFFRQQARREYRGCRILRASYFNLSVKRFSSVYDEFLHSVFLWFTGLMV